MILRRPKPIKTPEQIAVHYCEQAVLSSAVEYVKNPTADTYLRLERSVAEVEVAWQDYIET